MRKEKTDKIFHSVLYKAGLYLGKVGLMFKRGMDDANNDIHSHNNKKCPKCFQFLVDYNNGDEYDYGTKDTIKRISLKENVFIIDIYATIHSNDFYEYMDEDKNENDNLYEAIVEMQVRKDDELKTITMLDCSTGRDYTIDYEMLYKYYSKNSQSDKDLCNVKIIDLLGEIYNPEQI